MQYFIKIVDRNIKAIQVINQWSKISSTYFGIRIIDKLLLDLKSFKTLPRFFKKYHLFAFYVFLKHKRLVNQPFRLQSFAAHIVTYRY